MISQRVGNALDFTGILCHQVNCEGIMGAGIAKQIKEKLLSKEQFECYKRVCSENKPEDLLGDIQCFFVQRGRHVVNCFSQRKWARNKGEQMTDYNALESCLERAKSFAIRYDISEITIPGLIGCGLAGGDWNYVFHEILVPLFGGSDINLNIVYLDEKLFQENFQVFGAKEEEKWLLKISYSWGDEESDREFDTFEDAWNEAKQMAVNEAESCSLEHGSKIDLSFKKEEDKGTIWLGYVYDGTYCRYDIVKK